MKKAVNLILTISLLYFSFYYTNLVSSYIKSKDRLYLEIKVKEKEYYQEPINAIIKGNTIIPGSKGIKLDIDKSYLKMKRINTYLDSFIVLKKTNPKISIKNNYDKLVINGNQSKKNISILIKLNDINLLKKFRENNSLNFILTESFIKNNQDYLKDIDNNIIVQEANNIKYLSLIDYCYTNDNFFNYCNKYHKYTIKSQMITHDYYYETYKIIQNGNILEYLINNEKTIKDIKILINGIKNLGYNIVSLDTLLEE